MPLLIVIGFTIWCFVKMKIYSNNYARRTLVDHWSQAAERVYRMDFASFAAVNSLYVNVSRGKQLSVASIMDKKE